MKSLLLSSMLLLLFVVSGCYKKDDGLCYNEKTVCGTMTVIKDCTGSYLRYEEKDYKVCNAIKLDGYQTNDEIRASFLKEVKCTTDQAFICQMYHAHEGFIEIIQIR
jgi:hypothetical protein